MAATVPPVEASERVTCASDHGKPSTRCSSALSLPVSTLSTYSAVCTRSKSSRRTRGEGLRSSRPASDGSPSSFSRVVKYLCMGNLWPGGSGTSAQSA